MSNLRAANPASAAAGFANDLRTIYSRTVGFIPAAEGFAVMEDAS